MYRCKHKREHATQTKGRTRSEGLRVYPNPYSGLPTTSTSSNYHNKTTTTTTTAGLTRPEGARASRPTPSRRGRVNPSRSTDLTCRRQGRIGLTPEGARARSRPTPSRRGRVNPSRSTDLTCGRQGRIASSCVERVRANLPRTPLALGQDVAARLIRPEKRGGATSVALIVSGSDLPLRGVGLTDRSLQRRADGAVSRFGTIIQVTAANH